ncbi:MAG: DUF3006 domain-containing protein [Gemmatimonadaceae bacterium]|nr:DUF3006 domain-containing protein [Gemmatimonadaceae bacterium]
MMTQQRRTWTVDSLEEGIAAVEEDGGRMLHVPAWLLPDGVREGQVLSVQVEQRTGTSVVTVQLDRDATERAFARSREQLRGPTGNDPGGDIVL